MFVNDWGISCKVLVRQFLVIILMVIQLDTVDASIGCIFIKARHWTWIISGLDWSINDFWLRNICFD